MISERFPGTARTGLGRDRGLKRILGSTEGAAIAIGVYVVFILSGVLGR